MAFTTPFINAERGAKLSSEAKPIWLWDVEGVRIAWANQACLDFSGALTMSELVRLRFSPGAPFVRQLAIVSNRSIETAGKRELLRFPTPDGEYIFDCLCSVVEIEQGKKGVLVELVADKGRVRRVQARPPEKQYKNGHLEEPPIEPVEASIPSVASQEKNLSRERPHNAQQAGGMAGREEPPVNGFQIEAGRVDEEDLLTLQEIARMINGPAGGQVLGVASANGTFGPYGGAGRPVSASLRAKGGEKPDPNSPSQTLDTDFKSVVKLPEPGDQKGEAFQPELAPGSHGHAAHASAVSGDERNYFLESLPAALAIAMGGRLMRANETFLYAFGFGSERELRKAGGLAALFPQSKNGVLVDDQTSSSHQHAARRSGHSARIETLVVSRTGRKRQIPIAFRNVSTGREPVQILILHEDTLWQDSVRQSGQELENHQNSEGRSEKHVGQDSVDFLATVSHEVRTPLNSIIGFSELMKDERFGRGDVNKFRDYAADIHESALHALSLINDLLDITKIMAGKSELDFEALLIEDIAIEVLNAMRAQANKKTIRLGASFEEDLPAVLADKRSLKQILFNLVSNAIKFTEPGGQVTVSGRKSARGGIYLSVTDTGIGMHVDEIKTALEPFAQIKSAYHRARDKAATYEKGTGLGLPLTKALVKAHHASFKVVSSPGDGTTIEIHFPRDQLARQG